MYGIEVWYITNNKAGKEYFFKGVDRGRRLWTTRKPEGMFYCSEDEVKQAWEQIGRAGVIAESEYV